MLHAHTIYCSTFFSVYRGTKHTQILRDDFIVFRAEVPSCQSKRAVLES